MNNVVRFVHIKSIIIISQTKDLLLHFQQKIRRKLTANKSGITMFVRFYLNVIYRKAYLVSTGTSPNYP